MLYDRIQKGGEELTITQVSQRYGISNDTLRYYEKIGAIPPVSRTPGGVRDYHEEDLGWVELVICMRSAGLPIEMLIEYLALYQMGESTIPDRLALLQRQFENLIEQKMRMEAAIERLRYKISRYEIAAETGVLSWDDEESERT